jgi:hypothetical protein
MFFTTGRVRSRVTECAGASNPFALARNASVSVRQHGHDATPTHPVVPARMRPFATARCISSALLD